MSKLFHPTEIWAYLGGPWGRADHLLRLPVIPDTVLLLMEKGEACCNVAGHQICVLDGKSQWLAIMISQNCSSVPSNQFYTVHMHTHTYTPPHTPCAHKHTQIQLYVKGGFKNYFPFGTPSVCELDVFTILPSDESTGECVSKYCCSSFSNFT